MAWHNSILISTTNLELLNKKWLVPLLFFRGVRECVARFEQFYPCDAQNHLQGLIIGHIINSCARFPTKATTGIIASFHTGFLGHSGHMCIVRNQQTSIIHCLCLGFSSFGQEMFGNRIIDYLNDLWNPHTLLLLRLDLIIGILSLSMLEVSQEIRRFATALSTGTYVNHNPEESFPLNLDEISRSLTKTADLCAFMKFDIAKILRMLEDFREITTASEDAPDVTSGIDLRTAKWYHGEDILGFLISKSKCLAEECIKDSERTRAHIQTVCDVAVDGSFVLSKPRRSTVS